MWTYDKIELTSRHGNPEIYKNITRKIKNKLSKILIYSPENLANI